MFRKRLYYLIEFQYLGYNYHGWQKQPDVKTLEHTISRTLNYVLPETKFKLMAAGRTDAKVSAAQSFFELFIENHTIADISEFLNLFNKNLPSDIRIVSIKEVDEKFNILNDVTSKEYHYYFAFGEKLHPFCASILCTNLNHLDIETMKSAALLFKGEHDFSAFIYKSNANSKTARKIMSAEIVENTELKANFFPSKSYVLKIKGKGFGRNMVRLIIGALFDIGEGKLTEDQIKIWLKEGRSTHLSRIAPANGLILHKVAYS